MMLIIHLLLWPSSPGLFWNLNLKASINFTISLNIWMEQIIFSPWHFYLSKCPLLYTQSLKQQMQRKEWSDEYVLAQLHFMFASFPSLHRILYLLVRNCDLFSISLQPVYQNTLVFTQSYSFYSIRNLKWALLPLLPVSMFLLNPFILSIMSTKMTGKISNKSGHTDLPQSLYNY